MALSPRAAARSARFPGSGWEDIHAGGRPSFSPPLVRASIGNIHGFPRVPSVAQHVPEPELVRLHFVIATVLQHEQSQPLLGDPAYCAVGEMTEATPSPSDASCFRLSGLPSGAR